MGSKTWLSTQLIYQLQTRKKYRKKIHAIAGKFHVHYTIYELEAIYVPSIKIEGLRILVRYRKTLVKEINRYKSRTKSLLYYHGFKIPIELESGSKHWSKRYTTWLKGLGFETSYSMATRDSIIGTVEHLRSELLKINKELRHLEKQGEYSGEMLF